jgi:hypothetical protein
MKHTTCRAGKPIRQSGAAKFDFGAAQGGELKRLIGSGTTPFNRRKKINSKKLYKAG